MNQKKLGPIKSTCQASWIVQGTVLRRIHDVPIAFFQADVAKGCI